MSDSPSARPRRTGLQRLVIAGNVLVVFAFLVAAAGLGYAYQRFGQIPRVEIADFLSDSSETADGTGAENFLLVGVDSADRLDEDDPVRERRTTVGGLRSDTVMILRVDPASTRAALLSLPRDLYVPIAGTSTEQRINSAVQIGGPEALVQTIQDYFGIPINHYVQVDFYGFGEVVDSLGGVPMYFPRKVRDYNSGLRIKEKGCVTLDGETALQFVRSRAYQERIGGKWRTDGTGDLGRIRRQQEFIIRALDRAFDQGLRNPVTLDSLITSVIDSVTVDDTLDGDDMLRLADEFRSFNASALDMYDVPVTPDQVGGASVLRLDAQAAEPVLDVFRNRVPSTLTEATVRVQVLNGTGVPGQAADTSASLLDVGFAVAGTGDAASLGSEVTEVHHPPGEEAGADLVARWLVNGATLVEDPGVEDITLVTGSDYAGLQPEPEASTSTTSTTTTTLPTTTTTPPEDTSTTVLGTVPVETPEGVDCG